MKIKKLLYFVLFSFTIVGFTMVSCEGPAGPAGADGIDGIDGTDGTPGVAGNLVCLDCHTTAKKIAVTDQYNLSGHAAGNYVGYAGGRQGCARCHSHEGYIECQITGMDTLASEDGVPIPTAIGCGTCHGVMHNTLDFDADGPDYALRSNDPVTLLMYNHEQTLDMGNNSNVCAYCHQPRRAYTYPLDTDSFTITSSHWGPHHGPHATLVYGIGGYEVPGTESYPVPGGTSHFNDAGCIVCHMHNEDHTWHPSQASCTVCHAGATDFDIDGLQADIIVLIQDLEDALVAKGVMAIEDGEAHVVTGSYTADEAGAFYNYATMVDDRSSGVHNPDYIKALLTNSIESLQ